MYHIYIYIYIYHIYIKSYIYIRDNISTEMENLYTLINSTKLTEKNILELDGMAILIELMLMKGNIKTCLGHATLFSYIICVRVMVFQRCK